MTLDEARNLIGETVDYHPGCGRHENGVIVEVRDRYVMVRYHGDEHAKATDPSALHTH